MSTDQDDDTSETPEDIHAVEIPDPPEDDAPPPETEGGQTGESEIQPTGLVKNTSNIVNGRYKIMFESPLSAFSTDCAAAFIAVDEKNRHQVLALVCQPYIPFRTRPLRILQGSSVAGSANIQDSGMITHPVTGNRSLTLLLDMPEGGVLAEDDWNLKGACSEKDLMDIHFLTLLSAIEGLLEKGIVHRSIRPSNLWFMDRERQQIILGDCVTAPPGYNQPPVYETIERMMATRSGRGFGSHADDIYALGITLIGILLNRDPARGRDSMTLIAHKLMLGTFTALIGDKRFPQHLTQLLRGMVADTMNERWNMGYIRAWKEGRVINTTRSLPDKKATAPIRFLGKEYYHVRILAHALSLDPVSAATFITSSKLDLWLRRNLEAPKTSEDVAILLGGGNESGRIGSEPILVSQILQTLDPMAPMRYGPSRFCFDGIGPVLAEAYLAQDHQTIHALRILIGRGWIEQWVNIQKTLFNISLNLEIFVRIAQTVQDTAMGKGMERLLYDLNPSMPCMSPLFMAHNCLNNRALLLIMNDLAGANKNTPMIDKHTIAFLCARSSKVEHAYQSWSRSEKLGMIAEDLGLLALLATAQQESATPPLRGLANWAATRMEPVLDTYYSKPLQNRLKRRLNNVVKKGDIMAILEILGDQDVRDTDLKNYQSAVVKYADMESEIHNLEMSEKTRKQLAVRIGHRITSTFSYVILSISALYAFFF